MHPTIRELVRGLAGAAGFLLCALAWGMPLVLAAGIAVGVYVSLGLLLPKPPAVDSPGEVLGLNAQKRESFLANCRQANAELTRLALQVPKREFADRVRELTQTSATLLAYLEKKPEAILMSYSVPRNLEHLVTMLREYTAIRSYQAAGGSAEESLRKVDSLVETAGPAFHGMYQQLLNDDAAALETSAHTLAILMELDDEISQPRTDRVRPELGTSRTLENEPPLPPITPLQTKSAPPRLPGKERAL